MLYSHFFERLLETGRLSHTVEIIKIIVVHNIKWILLEKKSSIENIAKTYEYLPLSDKTAVLRKTS